MSITKVSTYQISCDICKQHSDTFTSTFDIDTVPLNVLNNRTHVLHDYFKKDFEHLPYVLVDVYNNKYAEWQRVMCKDCFANKFFHDMEQLPTINFTDSDVIKKLKEHFKIIDINPIVFKLKQEGCVHYGWKLLQWNNPKFISEYLTYQQFNDFIYEPHSKSLLVYNLTDDIRTYIGSTDSIEEICNMILKYQNDNKRY